MASGRRRLGHALAIFAAEVVPAQAHLILTFAADAAVAVLPVAHAFSGCGRFHTRLGRTEPLRELGRVFGSVPCARVSDAAG